MSGVLATSTTYTMCESGLVQTERIVPCLVEEFRAENTTVGELRAVEWAIDGLVAKCQP